MIYGQRNSNLRRSPRRQRLREAFLMMPSVILRVSWGHLRGLLSFGGRLGALSGQSWVPLWSLEGHLGGLWGRRGAVLRAVVVPSCGPLGPSCGPLRGFLGHFVAMSR
eukprot:8431912-Pyramimonas_sp.AAC.1